MAIIGYILLILGIAMALLEFTTFIDIVPALADLNIPLAVWIGVAIVGAILAMNFRRARD